MAKSTGRIAGDSIQFSSLYCLAPNVAHNVSDYFPLPKIQTFQNPLNRKPRNARSKRALDARQPKEIEDARMVLFLKGMHSGEVLNGVMKELACYTIQIPWIRTNGTH